MRATQVLSVEQRTVLRTLGGWSIADALIDPARGCAALRAGMWGGTYDHHGQRAHFDCTKRGIVVFTYAPAGRRDPDGEQAFDRVELVTVSWTEVGRYAAQLSPSTHDRLRAARHDLQVAWLEVCGPTPPPGRTAIAREPCAVAAAYRAHRDASQRLEETLFAALPLDEAPEQLDLFAAS